MRKNLLLVQSYESSKPKLSLRTGGRFSDASVLGVVRWLLGDSVKAIARMRCLLLSARGDVGWLPSPAESERASGLNWDRALRCGVIQTVAGAPPDAALVKR